MPRIEHTVEARAQRFRQSVEIDVCRRRWTRRGTARATRGQRLGGATFGEDQKKIVDQRPWQPFVQRAHDRAFQERELLHPRRARDGDDERPSAQPDRLGAAGDLGPDDLAPDPPDLGRPRRPERPIQALSTTDSMVEGWLRFLTSRVLSVTVAMEKALRFEVIFFLTRCPFLVYLPALLYKMLMARRFTTRSERDRSPQKTRV